MQECVVWYKAQIHLYLSLLMIILSSCPAGVFHFSVPELAEVGSEVGVVKATDADTGKNAEMNYRITDEQDTFQITTDPTTQEGVLILKKVGSPVLQNEAGLENI